MIPRVQNWPCISDNLSLTSMWTETAVYICWHGWLISVLVTQQPYELDSVWPHTPTLWDSFWESNSSCIFLFGVLVIILSLCSSVNRWRSKQIRSSSRGQWSLDLRVLLDSGWVSLTWIAQVKRWRVIRPHRMNSNDHGVSFLISQVALITSWLELSIHLWPRNPTNLVKAI